MVTTLLESTFLYTCLYVSLIMCISGIVFRITRWFTLNIGPEDRIVTKRKRLGAAAAGIIRTLFSLNVFRIFKIVFFDIILQARILKTDLSRWFMHLSIFLGFMMLLLMHALDGLITVRLFPGYYSTLDPFQFLRNLSGALILLGSCMAVYRRIRYRGPMLVTGFADRYAIAVLIVILVTGYMVEGSKMVSESVFNRMTEEFFMEGNPGDGDALKAFWSEKNGTVFSNPNMEITRDLIEKGKEINEENCASCHSGTKSAFISFPLSRALGPVAVSFDKVNLVSILYYIHVLACFIGLAALPFTKFFHLITNPVTIIINGLSDKRHVNPDAAMLRRAMELDACTNCGTCSRYCSVEPYFRIMHNKEILPRDKLKTVEALGSGRVMTHDDMQIISEGAFICTSCLKCTEVCPSGINLQDQWLASKELLLEKGHPPPHVWIKEFNASEWSDRIQDDESPDTRTDSTEKPYYNLTSDPNAFDPCIQCQTCTNVCPVVAARTDPKDSVDITPQKIMNLLRLGLNDLALGSRMVWDCTTCYQCQENCPQGIKVTEIIYELKNIAYNHFKNIDRTQKVGEDVC
jgi:heterodisulfide reductase subunit C/nitrate reductase gamma subunit